MSDLRTFITGDDKIKEVIKMLDDSKRIENDQYDQVKKIFDNYLHFEFHNSLELKQITMGQY